MLDRCLQRTDLDFSGRCFELAIGILSPFKVFRGFIVYFAHDDDEHDERRIQLPQERSARPAEPISVSV